MKSRSFVRQLLIGGILLGGIADFAHAITLFRSSRIEMRTVSTDQNAVNAHPADGLDATLLTQLLASLQITSNTTGNALYLMTENEAKEAGPELAKALGRVAAQQDVDVSVYRYDGNLGNAKRFGTGIRLFVQEGRLNLIFGDVDVFFDNFRTPDLKRPKPGQRTASTMNNGAVLPQSWLVNVNDRSDWVAFAVAAPPGPRESLRLQTQPDAPPDAVAPPAISTADKVPTNSLSGPENPRVPPVVPTPPSRSAPAAPAVPTSRWRDLEEGLETLKRLRDRQLITDKEYAEQRAQLLNTLAP